MAMSAIKFVLLFTITKLMLQNINCAIQWEGSAIAFGTSELYTFIPNISTTIQDFLETSYSSRMKTIMKSRIYFRVRLKWGGGESLPIF